MPHVQPRGLTALLPKVMTPKSEMKANVSPGSAMEPRFHSTALSWICAPTSFLETREPFFLLQGKLSDTRLVVHFFNSLECSIYGENKFFDDWKMRNQRKPIFFGFE